MSVEELLLALANRHRSALKLSGKIKRWYGRRGGSAQRKYVCYICDRVIDTESARYPITKHATMAISNHGNKHLEASNLLAFL